LTAAGPFVNKTVPDMARAPFERFLLRAAILALVLVAVSLGLIGWGVSLGEGFLRTLVLTVATATLSIGGISVLYEAYLRRTLTQDVLELVQLEERLFDAGIKDVTKKNTVDWRRFFENAEVVRIVPADPPAWIRDEWVFLIDARLRAKVAVDIYLPNPDGPLDALAERLGQSRDELRAELRRILRQVESDWKGRYGLSPRELLRVLTYDGSPALGLSIADRNCVISLPGLLAFRGAPHVMSIRFGPGREGYVSAWINEQFNGMSVGTYFST
jgi:hypothetical protein